MIVDFPEPDPELKAIGHRVKLWRAARGMSVQTLAAKIGIDPHLLERAERGHSRLTGTQLYAITLQLAIPMRLLFEDAAPPQPRGD